jgi:hypothetical protein
MDHFLIGTAIRPHCVWITQSTTNVDMLVDTMYQKKAVIYSVKSKISAKQGDVEKVRELLNYLERRPFTEFEAFLSALEETGNAHVSERLMPGRHAAEKAVPEKAGMFAGLLDAVKETRPIETSTERSNKTKYKVAVEVYTGSRPRSSVGLHDLPYVMGLQFVSRADVESWEGCPPGPILDELDRTYRQELESARDLVGVLTDCAVEIRSTSITSMEDAKNVLHKIGKCEDMTPQLVWVEKIQQDHWTDANRKLTIIKLHLLMYGTGLSIAVRRDFGTKPSCYLMFNAHHSSHVVRAKDSGIVYEELASDESNTVEPRNRPPVPRPF